MCSSSIQLVPSFLRKLRTGSWNLVLNTFNPSSSAVRLLASSSSLFGITLLQPSPVNQPAPGATCIMVGQNLNLKVTASQVAVIFTGLRC